MVTTEYNVEILIVLRDDGAMIDPGNGQVADRLTVAGGLSYQLTGKEPDLNAWRIAPVWTSEDGLTQYRVMNANMRQQDMQMMPTFFGVVCQDADSVDSSDIKKFGYDAQGDLIGGYTVVKKPGAVLYGSGKHALAKLGLAPFSEPLPDLEENEQP